MKRLAPLVISIAVLSMNPGIAQRENSQSEIAELTKLAQGGDAKAELSLGMRYRDGKGGAARVFRPVTVPPVEH